MRHEIIEPKPGQVWADNDARSQGRMLRIDRVDETYVYCTAVANDTMTQRRIDVGLAVRDMRGKSARIKRTRLKPTSTGYRLEVHADTRLEGWPACYCSKMGAVHENDCAQVIYGLDEWPSAIP